MFVSTRYLEVEHVGGPYDGQTVSIAVNEDGNPPEFYLLDDLTAIDYSVDPASGPQSRIATQFYERDMRATDNGLSWVYVWKSEHISDAAA